MSSKYWEYLILVLVLIGAAGNIHMTVDYYWNIRPQVAKLWEPIMKTPEGKEVSRIEVYDAVSSIVVKSVQQQTKETK